MYSFQHYHQCEFFLMLYLIAGSEQQVEVGSWIKDQAVAKIYCFTGTVFHIFFHGWFLGHIGCCWLY